MKLRVTSGVPQGSVLRPLLFLAYVNDMWRNINSNIRLFAYYCTMYRKIMDSSDIDSLQTELNRLEKWAEENEMKINSGKGTAVSFTKARVKETIMYYFEAQLIPEANSFKYSYLGITIRSDLNWAAHINYTLRNAWKVLHFIMRIFKKGNNIMKRLVYTALVRQIHEYRAVCWDPYREGQVNTFNRVQKRAAKFGNNMKVSQIKNLNIFIS